MLDAPFVVESIIKWWGCLCLFILVLLSVSFCQYSFTALIIPMKVRKSTFT